MIFICMHCSKEYVPDPLLIRCECGCALWVKPEKSFSKSDIITDDLTMWRYSKAYPLDKESIEVSFNETITPLAPLKIGNVNILAKMDSLMPTGSFKDRGAAMVVNYLNTQGIRSVSEDSSGNGGSAYAGYAAKGNFDCNIFVPAGTSLAKTVQTRFYGARCFEIEGSREDVAQAAMNSIETHDSYYVGHNWHPLFIEGVKSIAYEIWEQCGYRAPDNFIAPAGNGSLLAGAYTGFQELLKGGAIEKMPRLFGIQTEGIQPFVQQFNDENIEIGSTDTLAEGIKIQRSSRIDEIVDFVRQSNGGFISVNESQIEEALRSMGQQGFFIEPTSATAFAGIKILLDSGDIEDGQITVGVITGNGLKATNTLQTLLVNC
ncbi:MULTISPECIES: threonine synthase [Pseudoalteromonas]|uniref:Threonine synthase n=1 Tax=Pseudoalteromonas amylolytica TaxID=1859457 RepID=A0A1S1MVL3_9GAMM|nr:MULTISPECIES: threonine synthase [Pseudoalteromonas]OHU90569.1 threonine synthase [Pseudoalteromonas sp. JW3]OHU92810.1 threonine synthase [Pseudoalteromonas amylolytica]